MGIILDIIVYTLFILFAAYYWIRITKKIRQYFGRPYYDELPGSNQDSNPDGSAKIKD